MLAICYPLRSALAERREKITSMANKYYSYDRSALAERKTQCIAQTTHTFPVLECRLYPFEHTDSIAHPMLSFALSSHGVPSAIKPIFAFQQAFLELCERNLAKRLSKIFLFTHFAIHLPR